MANECEGTYSSTLTLRSQNGHPVPPQVVSEEEIIIDAHTGNSITGRRRQQGSADLEFLPGGTCLPNADGTFTITFRRREGAGEIFRYEGILSGDVILNGRYRSISGLPTGGDEGTWEAQQTGGFADVKDEQGDKEKKRDDEYKSQRQSS